MNENKRRFGIKHPFGLFPNAGVATKKFGDAAAKDADAKARTAFVNLGALAMLFGAQVGGDGDKFSLTYKGFTLFYEAA